MEAKMDIQQMPMDNIHTVFWREDQVTILFHSDKRLIVDGTLRDDPLKELHLRRYVVQLSNFLKQQGVPVTLHFLDESDHPKRKPMPQDTSDMSNMADAFLLPAGVYAFGFPQPIDSDFGTISTSVISFLRVEQHSSQGGSGSASMEMPGSRAGGNGKNGSMDIIPLIVNTLNENLSLLNGIIPDQTQRELNEDAVIPITVAAPNWLSGSTGSGAGQGCPLSPPMPVKDSCSNWHIRLPHLPHDLKSKRGDGVTVFVLDAFPERGVIARAARDAGDDNLLLRSVNETVTFDYSFMSGVQDMQEIGDTNGTFVGKDVYGRHYPIHLEDHGLFIAGIVRDLTPHARIECIRVLDDLCVGEVRVITDALNQIYFRKALRSGDLYGKPVVVNLSLVIPTDDEANSQGVITQSSDATNPSNDPWSSLKQPLQILGQLDVIVTASAGNEGDERESPGTNRPDALYPAKFAYDPYNLDHVIPVGAVDSCGKATSYSCYPGPRGVATYGGEVPSVVPPSPPYPTSGNPDVRPTDMMRGIYTSVAYPPLSLDPPAQYYSAPNDHAWAYWVGTSFATPVVASLAARVLELQAEGAVVGSAQQAIMNAASDTALWDKLDPSATGSGTAKGNMLLAVQHCAHKDRDEEDHEDED
jgi:Subtilase family